MEERSWLNRRMGWVSVRRCPGHAFFWLFFATGSLRGSPVRVFLSTLGHVASQHSSCRRVAFLVEQRPSPHQKSGKGTLRMSIMLHGAVHCDGKWSWPVIECFSGANQLLPHAVSEIPALNVSLESVVPTNYHRVRQCDTTPPIPKFSRAYKQHWAFPDE